MSRMRRRISKNFGGRRSWKGRKTMRKTRSKMSFRKIMRKECKEKQNEKLGKEGYEKKKAE
jgi:hypothetical protein